MVYGGTERGPVEIASPSFMASNHDALTASSLREERSADPACVRPCTATHTAQVTKSLSHSSGAEPAPSKGLTLLGSLSSSNDSSGDVSAAIGAAAAHTHTHTHVLAKSSSQAGTATETAQQTLARVLLASRASSAEAVQLQRAQPSPQVNPMELSGHTHTRTHTQVLDQELACPAVHAQVDSSDSAPNPSSSLSILPPRSPLHDEFPDPGSPRASPAHAHTHTHTHMHAGAQTPGAGLTAMYASSLVDASHSAMNGASLHSDNVVMDVEDAAGVPGSVWESVSESMSEHDDCVDSRATKRSRRGRSPHGVQAALRVGGRVALAAGSSRERSARSRAWRGHRDRAVVFRGDDASAMQCAEVDSDEAMFAVRPQPQRVHTPVSLPASEQQGGVRFVASGQSPPKLHDGPLPLHAVWDRTVWKFCTGTLGVPVPLPMPEIGPIDDVFTQAANGTVAAEGDDMNGELSAILRAMDERARVLSQQLLQVVDGAALVQRVEAAMSPAQRQEALHALHAYNWLTDAVHAAEHAAAEANAEEHGEPTSTTAGKRRHSDMVEVATQSLHDMRLRGGASGVELDVSHRGPSGDGPREARGSDHRRSAETAQLAASIQQSGCDTDETASVVSAVSTHSVATTAPGVPLPGVTAAGFQQARDALVRCIPGVTAHAALAQRFGTERGYAPVQFPPGGVYAAVELLHQGEQFANGDALLLRGLLALAEALQRRLHTEALDAHTRGTVIVSDDDDMSSEDDRSAASARHPGTPRPRGNYFGALDDSSDDSSVDAAVDEDGPALDPAMEAKLHNLINDPAIEAAAANYRNKKRVVSVPVLRGGGGSSAKLNPQHLPLLHQLVLLLRYAVRAFPYSP